MLKQNYLLVHITKNSELQKNNKIAIKFSNHANDNILFVDNVFQDGYQYVYQLWKCQVDVQEQIEIQILEVDEGRMKRLCKQSTLVQYSSGGERFKFSDGKWMDFVFLFQVQPKVPIDEASQTQKLRQMNEQMNQYLKHCKQEIQSYQEFLNFTNHIIQQLNSTTPQVEDKQKQKQEEKSTIIKQAEKKSRFETQQQEIASNNTSKTFSKRSQKYSSMSASEQKPISPELEDKRKSNKSSNAESPNRSQLQHSQVSSNNSRSFHNIDKTDATVSDLLDKAHGLEPQSKTALSKYSYLDQKYSKRYKKIQAFSEISEKSSEEEYFDQQKRKEGKGKVNQSEKYEKKRNKINRKKQRQYSYIQNSQPPSGFSYDNNIRQTKKKQNVAQKLTEYIKSRRQEYKKKVNNHSLKTDSNDEQMSSLMNNQSRNKKNQQVEDIKHIIKTKYSLKSTQKKSKTEPPCQESSTIQEQKSDLDSNQNRHQIQSERINIARYNNSSSKPELQQESQIVQAPVLKRRKKQSLHLKKQSLVGTNHKIQLLFRSPKTSSIRDNNPPPLQTQNLLTLKINSIKITTYTSSKVVPKRCMLAIGQHKYQTELKTSETNQIQWENIITIKPISYHSYIKATLISLFVNKEREQGDVKISVEEMTKNKKKMFKTHIYSQSLAIGFLQLKYTFHEQNMPHLPEVMSIQTRKSFSNFDKSQQQSYYNSPKQRQIKYTSSSKIRTLPKMQ